MIAYQVRGQQIRKISLSCLILSLNAMLVGRTSSLLPSLVTLILRILLTNSLFNNVTKYYTQNLNTSRYDQVKKFYDFWWEFKSWRDFRSEDEYDLEQAESREEKRWMEKQNEKMSAPLVRQERSRLLKLTGNRQRCFSFIKSHNH